MYAKIKLNTEQDYQDKHSNFVKGRIIDSVFSFCPFPIAISCPVFLVVPILCIHRFKIQV